MKVLLLSPYSDKLIPALNEQSDLFHVESGPISYEYCLTGRFDFIVSYGYRYLLNADVLSLFPGKAVNLHISMLPACRGAHPNFWAIAEQSISGVTIHLLDTGLDSGNILFQQEVLIDIDSDTFRSSYQRLSEAVERLFFLNWKYIRTSECIGWKQQGSVTSHRSRDLDQMLNFLPDSWDTPISMFKTLYFNQFLG